MRCSPVNRAILPQTGGRRAPGNQGHFEYHHGFAERRSSGAFLDMSATPADAALADAHAAWTTGERPRAIAILTAFVADHPEAAAAWARLGAYALGAARSDEA